ncbi:MAG TPA: glucokinase [Thermoanaerobaculia bacterium]
MILAGDVGGTKVNLGLFEMSFDGAGTPRTPAASRAPGAPWRLELPESLPVPRRLQLLAAASFASTAFAGLAEVVEAFLRQASPVVGAGGSRAEVTGACFGVAGPVIDNRTSTPNLAWEIDGGELARGLGLPAVLLINDLVATAEGIPLLADDELASLQAGDPQQPQAGVEAPREGGASELAAGNQVLIAAGTGLGMALLPVAGGCRVTVPSEGGHADYAPRDADEVALLLYLRRRFGEHVSVERVVSGPGLVVIYDHLRDAGDVSESPSVRAALSAAASPAAGRGAGTAGDPARVIAEAALAWADGLCGRALDMFISAYGAAAGNLALTGTAVGGVYIGGGIAPKILPRLAGGSFIRAFLDKGRFEAYLRRIPVRVLLNDRTAMLGAARRAAAMVTAEAAAAVPSR